MGELIAKTAIVHPASKYPILQTIIEKLTTTPETEKPWYLGIAVEFRYNGKSFVSLHARWILMLETKNYIRAIKREK